MTKNILSIIFWVLPVCTTCFGQSSFQEVTPGASTRNDVARALGQPVRTISTTLFEYKPPAGIAKIEAEYRAGSAIVERLEVYFVRPVSRPAMIKQFNLPQQADARKTDAEGKLVEYFGGSSLLALVYASADAASGVSHIGYYSPELFEKRAGKAAMGDRRKPEITLGQKWDMCETAWQTYCDTWRHQGSHWSGWGVPLKIDLNGTGVRVERYDRNTGLKAIYTGTISGNKIQGTVDFCCDGLGDRRGTWEATIQRK